MMAEMENRSTTGFYDVLASRKAEEAVWRRYQATEWLDSVVGPLGISNKPSEKEFISRLRNGLILCNAINKVHPGAITKVVENNVPIQSITRESQPLPAYQYFENVRNFLVAMEELKLPAFEASDLERDALEAGSVAKVVDCVLALKSYHEHKNMNGGNGSFKPTRSPMVGHNATRSNLRGLPSDSCRRLEMDLAAEAHPSGNTEAQKLEGELVKILAEYMADTKENMGGNFLASFKAGDVDPMKLFGRIVASCLKENEQKKFPEGQTVLRDCLKDSSNLPVHLETTPLEDVSENKNSKCCQTCLSKGDCNHRRLLHIQERELQDLKTLWATTRKEFEALQSQLQNDLTQCGIQVQEMASAAQGYQRVLKENRILYNMVQDLKGNIRVYCRVRPSFTSGSSNAVEFVGEDGSLVIVDPSKPTKDGRRQFQFNQVFGPTATQEEVFDHVQPLIRSVMDGYNVCIFAYGQTGSGKTYTMSGPSGGSAKDLGINYLALNDLFQMSDRRKDVINYVIRVQMVEIYNEQIRDLLAEDSSTTKLEIRSCAGDDGLTLPDAIMLPVTSPSDVLRLMKLGDLNRVVSSTAMNNRSSRSHRSLSCLGDVVTALAQKNTHIPYRNSKLTLLLQDSLGGHAKTLMFAHVSPEEDSVLETVSTLKFELGAAKANKESSEIMQLKEQVENLKRALANKQSQDQQLNRMKDPRSPLGKPMTDRTPPRTRRLSIENGSNTKLMKTGKHEVSKTPALPTRSRRLSLEAPTYYKRDNDDTIRKPLKFEPAMVTPQKYNNQQQDVEAMMSSTPFGYSATTTTTTSSSTVKIYQHRNPSRSPTSSSFQRQTVKIDSRTQVPHIQLPLATAEHQVLARNEVQIVMQSEVPISTKTTTTTTASSVNGKGSQIRKSLRSIGKLINGSEKR
ncbi:unnamed protein product [Linum tenue]|uniref:Uncharacterized protein n=1 Tax=Linum tenue TaxID=586396 RepID=A0AAV0M0B0_9ROSI|nr:unnamed protein product [Linum tenue]